MPLDKNVDLTQKTGGRFMEYNHIRVVSVDEEKSILEAEVTPDCCNIWGNVHGGFLYSMADTAAGALVRIHYGRRNVTLNGSIHYLRSAAGAKKVVAIGRPVKVGRTIGYIEVDLQNEAGTLLARAQMDMFFFE